jgi:hypothetical protein
MYIYKMVNSQVMNTHKTQKKTDKPEQKERFSYFSSVLDRAYIEPNRPISQEELREKREFVRKRLYLSDYFAYHESSDYFYAVRLNSKKETEIKETGNNDSGNCSVTWRLSITDPSQKKYARDIVEKYMRTYRNGDPSTLTYDDVWVENVFYHWLYEKIPE